MKKLFVLVALAASFMSLHAQQHIEYVPTNITIDIPDVKVDGTTIKAKATLFTMTYNQAAKYVSLNWTVSFYADSAMCYGRSLSDIIPSYARESIADNATAVNPATGEILLPDANGNYGMDWMGQYDWFNMIAQAMPIQVHDMIRQYGRNVTDWSKK